MAALSSRHQHDSKRMRTAFMLMVLVFAMTWPYSSTQPTDPQECYKLVKGTSSECRDRLKGILHFQFHGIKKYCCETISKVSDSCWPVIFPNQPYVRFILKGICVWT
ncbi:unnamed protein product [Eruca vesicaria subsp. sativa]|uniref:Prolamin-like domain-containing protein n=1 Tax=Eruca vesicaria subsp. sativa TaxID=29727 RepID=A0ABC8KUM1_ERUVS|nr:unnamed protein product [Eruca vesicaria subsp. sativa]